MSTKMLYGGARSAAAGGMSYVRLGRSSSNGTMSLSDSFSNFPFIAIATYFSSEYATFDMLPTALFENTAMPVHIRFDANGTYHQIQLAYASDTSVTVSNRASLNVDIYGIKV